MREDDVYLLPAGLVAGEQAAAAVIGGHGWPIADGALAFTSAGLIWREGGEAWIALAPYAELVNWAEAEGEEMARHVGRTVRRIGGKRRPWAGLSLERPRIMGVVNATPDSFSDGGRNLVAQTAIANALAMVESGADIIDVGGESTRPGAQPVPVDEEINRVLPIITALAEWNVTVSIDTRHAPVMEAAMAAGAKIINDVTALEGAGAVQVAAKTGAAVIVMHMQGQPQTMQADPRYACAPLEVYDYLAARVAACEAGGISRERIMVDPGIGFGKNLSHNAQILATLPLLHGLGCPVLLAASRKTFVSQLSQGEPPTQRLPGTLAAHLAGLNAGVQALRVHDVAETVQALKVWRALSAAG
ncbi:dihydropteroate synthase [Magnetospirillum sulfuroxidans]|uniref:dihydropteroate synthase n=1 Tax=Magnetospirillum sulfuroxidans TaxID=611300 RepID=UPI0031FF2158